MSGLQSFDQVEIRCRKGVFYFLNINFTNEIDRPTTPIAVCHIDNVVGDPSSLSDTRIKDNQALASQDSLCKVFDEIQPKTYDRIDSEVPEHRLGFIAQDVQQAINTHMPNVTNIISERFVGDETLLALDYSRLVCVLRSKVKQLEQRIAVLENK